MLCLGQISLVTLSDVRPSIHSSRKAIILSRVTT